MPQSKRNKLVTLSKVKKKTREWRSGLIVTAHKLLEEYPDVYLFKYQNMRNDKFKQLRERVQAHSRFCMGSNKVLKVALGKSASDEHKPNLHLVSEHIAGKVGLFFTSLPREEVVELFDSFEVKDFARVGTKATEDFELAEGPLEGPVGPLPHTIEPTLRKHGVPSKLNKGVVEVVSDYRVCSRGERLSANQAAVLRIFDFKQATFKLRLIAGWKADGTFDELADEDEDGEESDSEEDMTAELS